MIYIIGVDHLIQYNGPVPARLLDEFKTCLKEIISSHGITLLAEEFNEEFLHDVYGATEDTAQAVAMELAIEHRYCDPGEEDRLKLGIPYFADLKEMIKKKYMVDDTTIPDPLILRQIEKEAVDESKKYWALREAFWHDTIADRLHENILFICGHEHALRFANLLCQAGHEAAVIHEFWRRDMFSDYIKLGLR